MPNWKSYEATVRLLSAIVAAHPDLKLNYAATAEKFGDGTTGTPKKPRGPRTPRKNAKKAAATEDEGEGDDDSDLEMVTPSKKASPVKKEQINKVKGGRVTKNGGRAAKNGVKSYVENSDEDDDGMTIKDAGDLDYGHTADGDEDMLGGYANRNGVGNGGHDDDEERFYDDES